MHSAIVAGSERGCTGEQNTESFAELALTYRVGGPNGPRDLTTTVLGQRLALPVLISPTGVLGVAPAAEVSVARAAASRGTAMSLSCFAGSPVEDVVAANPRTLFQVHWIGSRAAMARQLERARNAGVVGLIATLDWSFSEGRDNGSPYVPEQLDARTLTRLAPTALRHPRWTAAYARARTLPTVTVPNMTAKGAAPQRFFEAYRTWQRTPPPSWDDVSWLRREWAGPFLLKGVLRVDDARRAVDAGVGAVSVSNHGGNNLDTSPAPIRVLGSIASAVGDEVEVLLDGGVRTGDDVHKALALGARAVLLGRAPLWGLAADGQRGVERVLDLLAGGIEDGLRRTGRCSVAEVTREDLVVPAGHQLAVGR